MIHALTSLCPAPRVRLSQPRHIEEQHKYPHGRNCLITFSHPIQKNEIIIANIWQENIKYHQINWNHIKIIRQNTTNRHNERKPQNGSPRLEWTSELFPAHSTRDAHEEAQHGLCQGVEVNLGSFLLLLWHLQIPRWIRNDQNCKRWRTSLKTAEFFMTTLAGHSTFSIFQCQDSYLPANTEKPLVLSAPKTRRPHRMLRWSFKASFFWISPWQMHDILSFMIECDISTGCAQRVANEYRNSSWSQLWHNKQKQGEGPEEWSQRVNNRGDQSSKRHDKAKNPHHSQSFQETSGAANCFGKGRLKVV